LNYTHRDAATGYGEGLPRQQAEVGRHCRTWRRRTVSDCAAAERDLLGL